MMKIILVLAVAATSLLPEIYGQGYGIQQPAPFPPAIDPVPLTDIEWNQPVVDPFDDELEDPLNDDQNFPGFQSNPPSDSQDPEWVNQPAVPNFPQIDQRPPIAQFPAEPQDPVWTSQGNPGRGRPIKRPGRQQRKPRKPRKPKQNRGNKCQRLAKRGSCRFYKCFEKIESTCLNQGEFFVQDLETFCQNAQFVLREKQFTKQGRKYINRVRKCQTKQLLSQAHSQSCSAINDLATLALLGSETGTVSSQDCYWQNQQFCDIICSPQDNKALVQVLFNDNDGDGYDEEQIALGEHLQYLAGFCSDVAQGIFSESFINECPTGTLNRPNDVPVNPPTPPPTTTPMMMMGRGGGD